MLITAYQSPEQLSITVPTLIGLGFSVRAFDDRGGTGACRLEIDMSLPQNLLALGHIFAEETLTPFDDWNYE